MSLHVSWTCSFHECVYIYNKIQHLETKEEWKCNAAYGLEISSHLFRYHFYELNELVNKITKCVYWNKEKYNLLIFDPKWIIRHWWNQIMLIYGSYPKNKKTILQAKMQIISLYIDLIGSNFSKYTSSCCYFIFTCLKIEFRCTIFNIVRFEIELKYLKL